MMVMFHRCSWFTSLHLVTEVLERWTFLTVYEHPSSICLRNDGLVDRLEIFRFTEIVWDSYFLTFEIDQHLDSWQVPDRFRDVFNGVLYVPTSLIQLSTLFRVSMPSTLVDFLIYNRFDGKLFCLVVFLTLRFYWFSYLCTGFGARLILFRSCDFRVTFLLIHRVSCERCVDGFR